MENGILKTNTIKGSRRTTSDNCGDYAEPDSHTDLDKKVPVHFA